MGFSTSSGIIDPRKVRKRVTFIIKDGDAQQPKEVLKALKGIFPNAVEGGCSWHIGKCFEF